MERITRWKAESSAILTVRGEVPLRAWLQGEMERLARGGNWRELHLERNHSWLCLVGSWQGPAPAPEPSNESGGELLGVAAGNRHGKFELPRPEPEPRRGIGPEAPWRGLHRVFLGRA